MKFFDSIFSNGTTKYIVLNDIPKFKDYFSPENSVVVIDENVQEYYGASFADYKTIVYTGGEQSKKLAQVENLINSLLDLEVDRSYKLIAVGGGVVCDAAGLAASLYMRGLKKILVPTTLLAQVDASVGGKTGVNHNAIKNLIGTISQPETIISCSAFLNTLPEIEFKSGLAEVVKTALIGSPALFEYLELNYKKINYRDKAVLGEMIFNCAEIKSQIVTEDEFESSKRMILNLGHTLGHAIESVHKLPHGLAVVAGMAKALQISKALNYIDESAISRILELFHNLELPIFEDFNLDELINLVAKDKKKTYSGKIKFVLLKSIGRPVISELTIDEINRFAN